MILPEIGIQGQETLRNSSVLVIGAGGIGSPLAMYLAAAGIGRLGVVDSDVVEVSNLHRQIVHGRSDVGRTKTASAVDRLREINPHIEVLPYQTRLSADNAMEIFAGFDIVADGTDNFQTRYLVNDACVLSGIPNVYASIYRFDGQVSVLATPGGPCYRCLFPEPPPPGLAPSCSEAGILGVLPGIVGTVQATEVIKYLLDLGESLVGRILHADALTMRFETMDCRRDPTCPSCGDLPTIQALTDGRVFSDQPGPLAVPEITVQELKLRLDGGEAPVLLDVRTPLEAQIESLGGLLIPLNEFEDRVGELAGLQSEAIVVYCRVGERSAAAVRILRAHGYLQALNLRGGLAAWKTEIGTTFSVI